MKQKGRHQPTFYKRKTVSAFWLPILVAARTVCIATSPAVRRLLEGIRNVPVMAQARGKAMLPRYPRVIEKILTRMERRLAAGASLHRPRAAGRIGSRSTVVPGPWATARGTNPL
jgi:hypothetical protein